MSASALSRALRELDEITEYIVSTESIRAAVSRAGSSLNRLEQTACALSFGEVSRFDTSYSRRVDHHLVYTSGYATFESFLVDRAKSVLRLYERTSAYSQLNPATQRAMRRGLARILDRIGWRRYEHLTERDIVERYHLSLSGGGVRFVDEAVISSDANFRSQEIKALFRDCGLPGVWGDVLSDPEIQAFLEHTRLEDNSVEAVLNRVVQQRNAASHSLIEDIDGHDVLLEVIHFLRITVAALFRASSKQLTNFLEISGRYRKVGRYDERYRNSIGIVKLASGRTLRVGDILFVRRDSRLVLRRVASMMVDGFAVQWCRSSTYFEAGVDFGDQISPASDIYMLDDDRDLELFSELPSFARTEFDKDLEEVLRNFDDASEA